MADLIERNALEAKIRENSMRIRFFDPSVNVILHLIRYAPAVNRWIPCSERLPEHTGYYLVSAEFDNIRGRQDVSKFVIGRHGGHWYGTIRGEYITHWMLLPEPPEKE